MLSNVVISDMLHWMPRIPVIPSSGQMYSYLDFITWTNSSVFILISLEFTTLTSALEGSCMVPKLDRSKRQPCTYRGSFFSSRGQGEGRKEADAARKLNRESPTSFGGVRLRSGGGQGGKEGGKAGWDGETEERSSWEGGRKRDKKVNGNCSAVNELASCTLVLFYRWGLKHY